MTTEHKAVLPEVAFPLRLLAEAVEAARELAKRYEPLLTN